MKQYGMRIQGKRWHLVATLLVLALGAQSSMAAPGYGMRAGGWKVSPFAEASAGYDSQARVGSGELQEVRPDGTFVYKDEDDAFAQITVGLGVGRAPEWQPGWDARVRAWYDYRWYNRLSDLDYDAVTGEGSVRYWPESDKYAISVGGKYRQAQNVERVPASATQTMPGETPLPYVEDRSDRVKRENLNGFADVALRFWDRTELSAGASVNSVDYDEEILFDNWDWNLYGEAGYRFSEKTFFFGQAGYREVQSDALAKDVPVVTMRAGFRTQPLVKVDYRIGVGVKTYEHATDSTGDTFDRKWALDFEGRLNWRATDKLAIFGRAWTDVAAAVASEENTRRTYAGQAGFNYGFLKRLNAVGSVTYRYDDYDFPVEYANGLTQEYAELWQLTGRLVMAPLVNTFWKVFAETSYEIGDNDLDTYDQWMVSVGAAVWY